MLLPSSRVLRARVVVMTGLIGILSCGGEVIAPIEEGVVPSPPSTCPTACGGGQQCCPGYACDAGACTPHLADDQCWISAFSVTCDPRLQGACAEGEACVSGNAVDIACRRYDDLGELGDACDRDEDSTARGCGPGLWCFAGVCRRACCSAEECGGDECSVVHGQIGSFGTCFHAP